MLKITKPCLRQFVFLFNAVISYLTKLINLGQKLHSNTHTFTPMLWQGKVELWYGSQKSTLVCWYSVKNCNIIMTSKITQLKTEDITGYLLESSWIKSKQHLLVWNIFLLNGQFVSVWSNEKKKPGVRALRIDIENSRVEWI